MSFRRLAASAPSIAMGALLATIGPSTGGHVVQTEGAPQLLLVAPNGATEARGAVDAPLALRAALEEAARRRASDRDTPLVIALQGGTYDLDSPIVIDSGLAGEGGITLEATPGADVRLVGWKKIEKVVTPPPKNIEDQLPDAARGRITYYAVPESEFPDLGPELPRGDMLPRHPAEMEFFVGDTPLIPARWPAVGYSQIGRVVDGSRVAVRDAPLGAIAGRTDVWFAGFPGAEWHYQRVQIGDVDGVSGIIRSVRPFDYRPRPDDFAALEGPPSLFSADGQFYLDRAQRVLAVWPPANDKRAINASDIAGLRLPITVLRSDGLDDSWLTVGFRHLAPRVDVALFTCEGMLLDRDHTRAIERRYADWVDLVGIVEIASEQVAIEDSDDSPSAPAAAEHEGRAGAVARTLRRRLRAPSLMSCALELRVAACGGLKFVTFSADCDWLSYALTLDHLRARGRTAVVWAEDLRELHLSAERRTGFDFGYAIYDRLSRISDYVDRGASPEPSYLNPTMEKIRLFAEQGLQLVLDPPSRGHSATFLRGMMAARRDSKARTCKLQREIRELG